MSIVCKWAILGEEQQIYFNSVDEMIKHERYNDFNYINLSNLKITMLPEMLPSSLEILNFNNNKIFELPELPAKLHSIFGENNRLSKFPDVSNCLELEDINLESNEIENLDCKIPENIKTINLNFNKLRNINYDLIPNEVKISASYCFLKTLPPDTHINNIKFDHNDIPDKIYFARIAPPARAEIINRYVPNNDIPNTIIQNNRYNVPPIIPVNIPNRIEGTDSQSVHQSSIQQSANSSLNYVLKYESKYILPEDLITTIINEYQNNRIKRYQNNRIKRSRILSFLNFFSKKITKKMIQTPPIRNWCTANDIHSQFGVTYKTLLKKYGLL